MRVLRGCDGFTGTSKAPNRLVCGVLVVQVAEAADMAAALLLRRTNM